MMMEILEMITITAMMIMMIKTEWNDDYGGVDFDDYDYDYDDNSYNKE